MVSRFILLTTYCMNYLFFLNNHPVEPPLNWPEVEFFLRRSQALHSMALTFTDEMVFTGQGAAILDRAYLQDGIDAEVTFRLLVQECAADEEITFEYTAIVNFNIFKRSGSAISVGIMQSGFSETFKNRMDLPVNLSQTKTLDGATLQDFPAARVRLHSKEIFFLSRWKINSALKDFSTTRQAAIVPPLELQAEELEESLQPAYYYPASENPVFYSGFSYPPGIASRSIQVKGRLVFDLKSTISGAIKIQVRLVLIKATTKQAVGGTMFFEKNIPNHELNTYDVEFNELVAVPADTNLFIQVGTDFPFTMATFFFKFNADRTFLELSEHSTYPPSQADGYLVYELLSRITESITGVSDSFRSDFFGRQSNGYSSDGEAASLWISNGLKLRNMLTSEKPGKPFPLVCSFNKLFEGLDSIYNLGLRIESENVTTPYGALVRKEYVRVEPIAFCYQNQPTARFSFVSDFQRAIALDLMYNEAEFGYQKWETEQVNGIDEFNSKRSYSLPLENHKKKLSKISNLITGGYAIELTRREQFKSKPSTDFRHDQDLFLIAVVKNESNGYEAERLPSDFLPIEGLYRPYTAYNLRLSQPVMPCVMPAFWRHPLGGKIKPCSSAQESATTTYSLRALKKTVTFY